MQLAEIKTKISTEWEKWTQLTPSHSLYDRTLLWLYLIFLAVGFLAVSSAGVEKNSDALFFSVRQATFTGLSFAVLAITCVIPIKVWERSYWFLLGASFVLLAITALWGINVNGAKRWITLGLINFQSAELAKLAIISYLASYFVRREEVVKKSQWSSGRPSIIVGAFCLILYKGQSDLGSSAILVGLMLAMLFIARAKLKQFAILLSIPVIVIGGIYLWDSGYRIGRLLSFSDPFKYINNEGYQLANAQMAFSQGGWTGVGYGNGVQKLGFLPEPHTDFVLAVFGEEFGWLGIATVMLLFCAMTYRIFKISAQSLHLEQRYKGFFAFGIGIWIFGQCFANLAVASGLLPTKGLTFPFISYGGSSLMIMSAALAIVLRIDHENRLLQLGNAQPKQD